MKSVRRAWVFLAAVVVASVACSRVAGDDAGAESGEDPALEQAREDCSAMCECHDEIDG